MAVTELQVVDREALQGALPDGGAVLVLADEHEDRSDAVCRELRSLPSPEPIQFLGVVVEEAPDACLDAWRAHGSTFPSAVDLIVVGETMRSTAATSSTASLRSPAISIDTVADAADLTGVAMAIGSALDAWTGSGRTPVVCFHSITSLLFHSDPSRVFRFLHSTTGRLRAAGAFAHYHLDPASFDEAMVNSFSALFDAVIEFDDDGTVAVRTRR